MIEGLEALYEQIAELIQEAIPEEWATAKMEAVFFPDSSSYYGEYTRKVDGVARSCPTNMNCGRAFRELRKRFRDAGKPLWGRACFELDATGKFNMKWGYDDCDENGNARFDEEAELKRNEERHKRLSGN